MPILQILSTILQVIPLVQAILHIPWFTVARTGIPSFVLNSPLFYSCTFQYIRCVAHLCIESRKTFILFRFLSLRMRYLLTFGLWGVEMILSGMLTFCKHFCVECKTNFQCGVGILFNSQRYKAKTCRN
jgi:hypothetical protein